ncbi:tripartite tricarboxylate transporter substrate-binding protein [Tardiphaga sp. P9-11]|uniref:Bug family tripartite tricarboxylate transporter substrate binding protein n=1 Tax=Tardiphaga sp. P9-11 TaxID=2024614 RepID=UPI0011F3C996|nr:tripartite tricarboxylate transporter substrate-binding protein [Tardiphaga sp. P9-11]KAA0073953.1 tripartite tricarboxylate transporter substrate binding protein [Tardiphaga sp. P9-11]
MLVRCLFIVAAFLSFSFVREARAEYPDRPIHLIVALPPGGSVDVVARILAEKVSASLGEPIVVENRPGASGIVAAEAVSTAEPDGYTVLFTTSALTTSPWMLSSSFDPVKSLLPVVLVARAAYVLVVRPSLGVNSLDEFVALAKAQPGKLNCSTYGVGSPPHLALEMLKDAAGLDIVHIPYRGFGQALPDMMSGLLSCAMEIPANVEQQIRVNNLKAIAVTTAKPIDIFPGVPPIATRFPKVIVDGWQGVLVPERTPQSVVSRLNMEFVKALRNPDTVKRLRELGFEPIGNDSATAATVFRNDYERFGVILNEMKGTQR